MTCYYLQVRGSRNTVRLGFFSSEDRAIEETVKRHGLDWMGRYILRSEAF